MEFDYIIVQAGGKGTRMEHLTENKPKALVPVNNRPMIFHLFEKYPRKKFIIIGDYKFDVLKRYLAAFANVDYTLVNANGRKGTCGGLKEAVDNIPDGASFMLIWSDLVLPDTFKTDGLSNGNYVCLSGSFPCRWRYEDNQFVENSSVEYGVAGMFIFSDKSPLQGVPESGEFVRWLKDTDIEFQTVTLDSVKEFGLISEYMKIPTAKCRPFNSIEEQEDSIIKRPITKQGEDLAKREIAWYRKVMDKQFLNLPKIYSYEPLTMEKIRGSNIYEYENISYENRVNILTDIVNCLKSVHLIGSVPADKQSYNEAYIYKTLSRLEKVKQLVPFANDETIVINGKRCPNFFFHIDEITKAMERYLPDRFVFLHGDCTFSNILLRNDKEPVLIDPRGYFGLTEFYGDVAYDWAKLYYSLVGNYDQFNLKRFDLHIHEDSVELFVRSSGWEELEDVFFRLIGDEVTPEQIRLIHAIIWLSLTTYAWEDYDSICGAFYNGLLYLSQIL